VDDVEGGAARRLPGDEVDHRAREEADPVGAPEVSRVLAVDVLAGGELGRAHEEEPHPLLRARQRRRLDGHGLDAAAAPRIRVFCTSQRG
jgi:hypothetical protein